MAPVIQTSDLTKNYPETLAVDRLNLEVKEGEVFGLLGPNGAGKTTTIMMLMDLVEPTSGHAKVCGFDSARDPLEIRRRVGYLPEYPGFYDDLTARQNLLYTAKLNGVAKDEARRRVSDTLERVGLAEATEKKVGTFSRGMKQRLGIADVLVKDPQVLILDEPTASIDPEGVKVVLDMISRVSKEGGKAVLLSSHLLYQVQRICDRVGIFVKGKMIAQGPIQGLGREVIGEGRLTVEVDVQGPSDSLVKRISGIGGVESAKLTGSTIVVQCTKDVRSLISRTVVEAGFPLNEVKAQQYALDEIYAKYFAGEKEEKAE